MKGDNLFVFTPDFGDAHRSCNEVRAPRAPIAGDYMGPNRTDECSIRRERASYPSYSPRSES
jgi:hypothetical protein